MRFYAIKQIATGEVWAGAVAESVSEALERFGEMIGMSLTMNGRDRPPDFLLAEHADPGPHWVKFRIPVHRG